MQTHCPHCKTQFRVTEAQINVANGFVRCGICEKVFNVFEVVAKAAHQEHDYPPSSANAFDADDDLSEIAAEPQNDQQDISKNQNTAVNNDSNSFAENYTTSSSKIKEDALDFFNEEITESLSHVVPEKLRRRYASDKRSATSTLLWTIGTLLLTASLFLEYIWFHRDQYRQIPELQAVMDKLCQQINCSKVSMRDASKIELIARNIYTHPNEKNALMVDVTMKNNARFSQPYPVMNISFSDIRGNAVASRNFYPHEYLPAENKPGGKYQQALLPPDTSASLTLEIQDPGKHAMTYEFNFL